MIPNYNPVLYSLNGTSITFFATVIGAALIFFFKKSNKKVLDTMLGFAAGVMIAASFWSLLLPALEMSKNTSLPNWLLPAIGFVLGAIFLRIIDKLLPHLHINFPESEAEGMHTHWKATTLLFLAMTIHNIPEGLAVGVAFGSSALKPYITSLTAAMTLAVGIGIQNIPEGFAVSASFKRMGLSNMKSFYYGVISGAVEPIAGLIGAFSAISSQKILPLTLAFAAGAMIFVVVEEVIPESQKNGNTDLSTMGVILGFVTMMILDVAFS